MNAPHALSGLEFHHVGVACRKLEREQTVFENMGYRPEGEIFVDPTQGIRGRFLTGAGPRMELVEPLDSQTGVLTNVLAQGLKMYHLAYTTPDMERSLAEAVQIRGKVMVEPVPAVAFDGRRIAFVFLPNMLLMEFIER
ncbi:MAG: VOC family protein [Acidihalobacter sp.]|jgi:methylmalonyl-CoA/ethylmalonyl-CoA epimerase|uniref:VOC family protein n=1 Tax=Acidihalobacter sp. TaxID=1872108 RepID=UPI00307FA9A1